MQTIRSSTPTARNQHQCSLCAGPIRKGDKYERQTNVFDGRVYDWITCKPCIDDIVITYVSGWTHDGYATFDAAQEWASEMVIHGDKDEQQAAKNYLERGGADA